MKKKLLFLIMFALMFVLGGCGKISENDVIKDLTKKINNSKAYYIEGTLEIVNNEDVYTYDVEVSYAKKDNYKVNLVNTVNNHEQIILRNSDGVYVVTPRINKSFKFQSDWPYNNSQVYLLTPLLEDITNDDNREFTKIDDGYKIVVAANYPNNPKLVKQEILLDKKINIKKVTVMDTNGNPQITMKFEKIDLNSKFDDDYFDLKEIIDVTEDRDDINSNTNVNNNTNTNDNSDTNNNDNSNNNNTTNNSNDTSNTNTNTNNNTNTNTNTNNNEAQEPNSDEQNSTKQTATIDDIIYPMYLPTNTYLTNQERVNTEDGERLILTFTGDSSFVLVEETAIYSDTPEIIPTYGDVELIGSSLAVINDNSANWFDNGIEYYIVSDVMSSSELLQVVRSISVLPVSK